MGQVPPRPSPIGPQRCMFDPQNWQMWSDLGCNSTWPSLASDSVSYSYKLNSITRNCLVGRAPEWSSSATPWMTSQFGHRLRLNSWFLGIGRSDPVEKVSPSPPHSCGIYFLPTSVLHNEYQLFRKRLKTHYMQQSVLRHWGSMSPVGTLLPLLVYQPTIMVHF